MVLKRGHSVRISSIILFSLIITLLISGCARQETAKQPTATDAIEVEADTSPQVSKAQVNLPAPESGEVDITKTKGMKNMCTSLHDCFAFCKNNVGQCSNFCKKNPTHELCVVPSPAEPQQWVRDAIIQPLPPGASTVRLTLPGPIDEMPFEQIGAFGAHPPGHAEGLDHEWLWVKDSAPIKSWADGYVVYVNPVEGRIQDDTPAIIIYYGDGLWGEHMHVQRSLVKPGDTVKAGDPVGYGELYPEMQGYHFAEFNVADQHRQEGVGHWYTFVKGATFVSPFDYLRNDVQRQFVEKWQREVIDSHLLNGDTGKIVPTQWEPYLTNPMLFHREYPDALVGEWFLRSKPWATDDAPDILLFFTNNTKYYHKQKVVGVEDDTFKTIMFGDWDVDYDSGRFTITTHSPVYYGIFEIDESGELAQLTIEYQEGSYPDSFSENALIYTERDTVSKGSELFYWQHPEYDPRKW